MFSTSNGVRDTYSTVRVIIIKENEYVQLCFWSVDGKGKKREEMKEIILQDDL